ncbi:protein of unknown function (plasmid) [Clostridium beijerinckii]|nr:protein of unknown function [Clostridium beijerinckii]
MYNIVIRLIHVYDLSNIREEKFNESDKKKGKILCNYSTKI